MATYTETAWGSISSGYPTSVLTKRWTTTNETLLQTVSDTSAEDGYLFEQEWSAAARRLNSLNAIDSDANRDDIELLCRFRLENTTRIDYEFGLAARASGSGGSETGFEVYTLEGGTDDIGLRLTCMNGGSNSTLIDTGDILYNVDNEWLWLRFRVNGATSQAKLWRDTDIEPSYWHGTLTDSTVTGVGWAGLWGYGVGRTTDIDYLSIGTNGDAAPLTPDTSNTVRLSTVNATVLANDSDPTVRLSTVNATVLANDSDPTVRLSTVNATVMYSVPPIQVQQEFAEALYTGTVNATVQQEFAEALYTGTANAQIQQEFVEVLWTGSSYRYHNSPIYRRRKAMNALLTR